MRIVFDTNVIVAGLVADGLCREILEVHLPEHIPILSDILWNELIDTLRDRFELEPDELPLLHLYRRHGLWVEVRPLEEAVCRDPDDDWVLATALAGRAEAIVTGDDDLRSLRSFEGIEILSPRQFLQRSAST